MKIESYAKRDIEEKIKTMGDYVKIDYLASTLKANLDFETRKYVLNTLANIYEQRGMYSEGARLIRNSADINTTFDGKIKDFMKSVELFIKSGNFEDAEATFGKAIVLGTQTQKNEIKLKKKAMYFAQAQEYIKKDKRKHAMLTFEKILSLELSEDERNIAKKNLAGLYEKLGKVKEFYNINKIAAPVDNKREERKDFRDIANEKRQVKKEDSFVWDVDSL